MNITNADYFTFNVHHSALVVGQTGSGKTELVRSYIRRLEQAFTPEQMQYIIYDLKQVEFDPKWDGGAKLEYLYTPIRTGTPEDMDYLEELADLAQARADGDKPKDKLLFTYIEECDMAYAYPDRFSKTVMRINRYAAQANMKLIFSTSSPSPEFMTPDFRDSFDLILCGLFSLSPKHTETIGIPQATNLNPYQFIVKENATS